MSLINVIMFRNFTKRKNSTKKPEGVGGVFTAQFNGVFIDGTSIQNPQIRFTDNYPYYLLTYANIPLWNDRYYYIDDWTHTPEGWTATMHVDTLATYKSQIGDSTQYVLRECRYQSPDIVDNTYPITTQVSDRENFAENSSGQDIAVWPEMGFDRGCYIVSVCGQGGQDQVTTIGTQNYFCFNPYEFQTFIEVYFASPNWMDGSAIVGVPKELVKLITNPSEYITSCRWFPFSKTNFETVNCENTIKVGWWFLFTQCRLLSKPLTSGRAYGNENIFFKIPKHPQLANYPNSKYLNSEPYSQHTLTFAPFGEISIPTYLTKDCDKLLAKTYVDLTSGYAALEIFGGYENQYKLGKFYAKLAVDIPLTQSGAIDFSKALASGANVAAGIVTGNVFGAVASAGIGAAQIATNPGVKQIGDGAGTFLNISDTPYLKSVFRYTTAQNIERFGAPYCSTSKISQCVSSAGNFIQTLRASVDLNKSLDPHESGTQAEREEVETYMDGGIYYE